MRFHFLLSSIVLGLVIFSTDAGFSQVEQKLPIKLTCPEYDIGKTFNENLNLIKMKGFSLISNPGKPMLPYKFMDILLPENVVQNSVKITIDNVQSLTLPGTYLINSVPRPIYDPKLTIGDLANLSQTNSPYTDNAIYTKNSLYPEKPILLMPIWTRYSINGKLIKYSRISFTPLQYNPISKKLILTKKADLTISYQTNGSLEHSPFRIDRSANYVIITTNKIKANSQELNNFVNFKNQHGFTVRVITESDFEKINGPYPDGRAEKIRQWLVENWQTLGIQYVLLIGNPEPDDPMYTHDIGDEVNDLNYKQDDSIPMKQVWHGLAGRGEGRSPYFNREAPLVQWGDATDWYYADLSGNWDADGDGFYGESPWLPQSDVETSNLPNGIDIRGFSVRWKKKITMNQSSSVTLYLKQWKGARIYIDNQLVVNHWPQTRRKSDTIIKTNLDSGDHEIIVEYYQNSRHGHILAQIDLDSNGPLPPEVLTGCRGEYYNNPRLHGRPTAVLASDTLWKNWETSDYVAGDPGPNRYGLMGGVDLNAEVSVGRIPVFESDYETLDKILINSRKGIAIDAYRKILLPMRKLDNSAPPITPAYDLGEAIVNDILANEPSDFSAYRIYDENYGLNPAPDSIPCEGTNVVNGWNKGCGYVAWLTHGTWRKAVGVLDVKIELPRLINNFRPIVFAASCFNGNIYLPDCYPGCMSDLNGEGDGRISLGYSLLKDVASAVISSTEVSTYQTGRFVPDDWSRLNHNFSYLYTKEIISYRSSVGDALKRIKYSDFSNQYIFSYGNYHQQLIYNLFGDPSLYLRSQYTKWPPRESLPIYDMIIRDFVPDICQYATDCPVCLRLGLCDTVSFSLGPLNELFAVEVRNHSGEIVASSPNGNIHSIKFQYNPKDIYALVLKPEKKEGFRKRLNTSFPQIKFSK